VACIPRLLDNQVTLRTHRPLLHKPAIHNAMLLCGKPRSQNNCVRVSSCTGAMNVEIYSKCLSGMLPAPQVGAPRTAVVTHRAGTHLCRYATVASEQLLLPQARATAGIKRANIGVLWHLPSSRAHARSGASHVSSSVRFPVVYERDGLLGTGLCVRPLFIQAGMAADNMTASSAQVHPDLRPDAVRSSRVCGLLQHAHAPQAAQLHRLRFQSQPD
jgi:hypothetical protein